MTQEKKVQTAAVMDVTGVERAAQEAVRTVRGMADGMVREGERAGKGLEGMGAGAEKAERTVDAATKSISDRIRRLTRDSQRELASLAASSSGGAGSASSVEYEATLRGANVAKLQPQINALRELQAQAESLSAAMRRAAAGDEFIASINGRISALQQQAAGAKMAEADLMALKAAELGVTQAAGPLIAQLRLVQAETDRVAKATREAAEADKRAEAARRQQDAAQKDFLSGLREQSQLMGKSAEDILRYRAAQLGIGEAAAPIILQLQNQKAAQEAAAQAARDEAEAQRQVAAEKRRTQSAQNQFIASLKEQAATQGMQGTDLLRYRASALGVSEEAEQYIARIKEMDRATEATAFVRSIEARTAALAKQAQSLEMTEADMLQLQAAQKGLAADAGPAIEALRRQAVALQEVEKAASGRKFLEGLTAQTGALGKTRADLLEMQAAQLGVAEKAAPMIAAIRAADGELAGMGKNAKQMQWALRGLPAQFTDIWVSLASGQNPMMVFIQQGGQIKDMFGGIGPAARAMGGYLLGLVNPFTVAAAAAGVFLLAIKSGADDVTRLQQASILAGQQLGITAGGLQGIAQAVQQAGSGSFSQAVDFLTQVAGAGRMAADDLRKFTDVTLRMEAAGGPAAKDMAKALSELGKDPLQASIKLTDQYNYLTAATYQQIKALVEQGRTTEAATLAQKEFFGAMEARTPQMLASLGFLERSWNAVSKAIKGVWDSLKNVGVEKSIADQIGGVDQQISNLRKEMDVDRNSGRSRATREAAIAALEQQKANLQEVARMEQRGAEAAARRAAATQAAVEWDKAGEQYVAKNVKMANEIAQARAWAASSGKTEKELAERIAAIQAKYADKGGAARAMKPLVNPMDSESLKAYARGLEDFQRISLDAAAGADQLSKSQAKLRELQSSPTWAQYSRQQQEQLIYSASLAQAEEDRSAAHKAAAKAVSDAKNEYTKWLAELGKGTEQAQEQAQRLRDEAEAQGLVIPGYRSLEQALVMVEIARLRERQAAMLGNDDAVMAIQKEIDARTKLIELIGQADARKAADAESKRVADEIRREQEKIGDALTDALMGAFEKGKSFAQSFRDSVVNMFKTMVLKPIIQAIVNPVASAFVGGIGIPGAASAAGAGGFQVAGVLDSLQGMYRTITGGFQSVGTGVAMTADKLGEWLVMNTTGVLNKAGGTLMQSAGTLGSIAESLGGAFAGYGIGRAISGKFSVGGSGSTLPTVGALIGSILGPVGGAIGGAIGGLINRAFGRGPKETQSQGIVGSFSAGAATGQNFADWKQDGGWFRSDRSGTDFSALTQEMADALNSGAKATFEQTKAYASALNLPAEILGNIASDFKVQFGQDAEKNKQAIADAITAYGETLSAGYARLLEPFKKAGEDMQVTLARLATLQNFSASLNALGGVFSRVAGLSVDAKEEFIALAGGMESLFGMAKQFAQDFYSREEIAGVKAAELQTALAAVGVDAAAITSKADYRALVDAADITTSAGREQLAALLQAASAFTTVADYMAETGASLAQVAMQAPAGGVLADILNPNSEDLAAMQIDATNGVTNAVNNVAAKLDDLAAAIKSQQDQLFAWTQEVGGGA